MRAVIFGASGLVGSLLLQKLLRHPSIKEVISVGRKALPMDDLKLQQIQIRDFTNLLDLQEDLKGELFYCCLGTTIKKAGSKEQFRMIDELAVCEVAAIAKMNRAFSLQLVSSAGADPNSLFFYNKVKGQMELAVQALQIQSLGIYRPSLLSGDRTESRPMEKAALWIAAGLSRVLPEAMGKKILTSADDLAELMLQKSLKSEFGCHVFEAWQIKTV